MPGITPERVRQLENQCAGKTASEEHNSLSISLLIAVNSRNDVIHNGWKGASPVQIGACSGFVNREPLDIKWIFCEKFDPT